MKRIAMFVMLVACHARSQPSPQADAAITVAAPTATASAHLIADAGEAGGAIVIVSKRSITIDDMPILTLSDAGIDSRYEKPGDAKYVVPLALELEKFRERDKALLAAQSLPIAPSEATLIIDKDAPYRTVAAVLYTLEQTGFGRYHFMVLHQANEKTPPTTPARHPVFSLPPIAVGRAGLALSVRIDASGFTVSTSGGGIAPGCNKLGSGVTLPKRAGVYDFEALTACARAIHDAAHGGASSVVLTPDTDILYERIIQTMDALRNDDAGDLFPDVTFAR